MYLFNFYLQISNREVYSTYADVLQFLICRAGRISSCAVVHAEYAYTRYLYWRVLLYYLCNSEAVYTI